MGVSKLTTYMEDKNCGGGGAVWARMSLDDLPEGRLVIDGNSLCFWLYESLQCAVSVGGSYPKFYELVRRFFETLTRDHKIHPIVVFDGIKPDNETSRKRRKGKFVSISNYQSGGISEESSDLPLPLMTKEVFLDALEDYGDVDVHFVDGEADAEIVAIANYFGSPVMSSDSDFYMYKITGGYIPLKISDDSELQSSEVDIFSVDRFTEVFKLRDEDLRFILPAVFGNEYIRRTVALIYKLQLQDSTNTAKVSGVIEYASRFASFDECLAAAVNDPALVNNLKLAKEQYKSIPRPSYPRGLTPVASVGLSSLRPEYREPFQLGRFQTFMVEAVVHGETIFRPVFDDITRSGVQDTSMPIRQAIYSILGCQDKVIEIRRHGGIPQLTDIPVPTVLPAIQADRIPRSTEDKRKSIMLSVLACDRAVIDSLPIEWQLPVASAVFWRREGRSPRVIVEALVACFVTCYGQFPCVDQAAVCPPPDPTQGTPQLEVVHYLTQWQCAYFDIVALNQLLLMPFQYTSPAKLFDALVAVKYATDYGIETILKSQGHNVELYRQLLDAIFPEDACRKR